MDFCAKIKLKMMKLLDTKHNWLLKVVHKTLYWLVKKKCSLVLDATTLQYSIILVAQQGLHLHLMNDVTSNEWCYKVCICTTTFENHIYMKIPEGFYLPNETNSKEGYSIKLNMLFYWLKRSRRVWHNCLFEYLLKEGYKNDPICSCIYMKRSK